MISRFWDAEGGGFFTVGRGDEQLIAQRKPVQDGATPSGNSLAARALARLYALTAEGRYADHIEAMRDSLQRLSQQGPNNARTPRRDKRMAPRSPFSRARRTQPTTPKSAQMRRDLWTSQPRPNRRHATNRSRSRHSRPPTRRQANAEQSTHRLRLPGLRLLRPRPHRTGAATSARRAPNVHNPPIPSSGEDVDPKPQRSVIPGSAWNLVPLSPRERVRVRALSRLCSPTVQ